MEAEAARVAEAAEAEAAARLATRQAASAAHSHLLPVAYGGDVPRHLVPYWNIQRSDGRKGGGWMGRCGCLAQLVIDDDPVALEVCQLYIARAALSGGDGQWVLRVKMLAKHVVTGQREDAVAFATMLKHKVDEP